MSAARKFGRILVVDSDFHYATWLANIFSDLGLDVRTVMDAASAALVLDGYTPDLLLVEYLLPPVGGVGFVDGARKRHAAAPLPVLYSVPFDNISPLLRDQLYPLDGFVVRPSPIPELVERAQHILQNVEELPAVVQGLGRFATRYRTAGYRRADLSVLFADVRGFTSFSEAHDPETAAGILNSLFEVMAAAVLRYGGIIDKYIGDAMMAIFGYGTQESTGHEQAALYAAQDLLDGTQRDLADNLLVQGARLGIGLGVHTGYALVGPIGATFRRDVTAIGDTVNVASRLCDEAQPGEILISSALLERARPQVEVLEERQTALKGKRGDQRIFRVAVRKPAAHERARRGV